MRVHRLLSHSMLLQKVLYISAPVFSTISSFTVKVQSYSWKKFLRRPFTTIFKQRSQWCIQDCWLPGQILPLSFVQGCPPGGVTHTHSFLPLWKLQPQETEVCRTEGKTYKKNRGIKFKLKLSYIYTEIFLNVSYNFIIWQRKNYLTLPVFAPTCKNK